MIEKLCPICKQYKNIDDFYTYFSKKRNKYRTGNYCKNCSRIEGNKRAKIYYQNNIEEKKKYAKNYRANELNKEKLKILSKKFKRKYREELKDCYVREYLSNRNGIPLRTLIEYPEIVEVKRLQLKIKRKLKILKNGTK